MKILFRIFCLIGMVFSVGCAYHLQGNTNPWKEKGITRVYVNMLVNNSLRAGIEVPFTSSLIRAFSRGNKIRLVSDIHQADATVDGSIENVASSISNSTSVPQITTDPTAQVISDFSIASEYQIVATILVKLTEIKTRKVLWSQSFSKTQYYPANNRYGLQGTTSSLINDTEEQRALTQVADVLAADAYDNMFEVF